MKRLLLFLPILLLATPVHAARSVIVETDGSACAAAGSSMDSETEKRALNYAKHQAQTAAADHVARQAGIEDAACERDLTGLYSRAPVRVIQELKNEKYRDAEGKECVRLQLKAEVLPDEKSLEKILRPLLQSRPSAIPLDVRIWTERKEYRQGEKIKIFLKGNKPFFAKIIYIDAGGNQVQILPNPFRQDAAFDGDKVYTLPDDADRYELEVSPPFGDERITAYAGTFPPGELEVVPAGGVYSVTSKPHEVEVLTRRIKPPAAKESNRPKTFEFTEATSTLITRKGKI